MDHVHEADARRDDDEFVNPYRPGRALKLPPVSLDAACDAFNARPAMIDHMLPPVVTAIHDLQLVAAHISGIMELLRRFEEAVVTLEATVALMGAGQEARNEENGGEVAGTASGATGALPGDVCDACDGYGTVTAVHRDDYTASMTLAPCKICLGSGTVTVRAVWTDAEETA